MSSTKPGGRRGTGTDPGYKNEEFQLTADGLVLENGGGKYRFEDYFLWLCFEDARDAL